MAQLTIVPHGDSAAVVLPKQMLESLGLGVGDKVDATLADRQLILRPLDDAERRKMLTELTTAVLDSRSEAYRRLA
jgi:antitoxin component of MazEF toxin-antitoxin module